ncbi:hypothetical protein BpHYR1_031382 [Brachionus plicatilis]|uniref:Uncharacterized protein n=1 Tax=Brachionus plicatilis TaxID=10195 RepID=A0A3M7STK6_BRAPC|nr:hypothetical protein BpHYR1_031382 [Brachionus plicatilis]
MKIIKDFLLRTIRYSTRTTLRLISTAIHFSFKRSWQKSQIAFRKSTEKFSNFFRKKNEKKETLNLDKFKIPAIFKYCICIAKTPLAKNLRRNYFKFYRFDSKEIATTVHFEASSFISPKQESNDS